MLILDTPLGHEAYVKARLSAAAEERRDLLKSIPAVQDLQCAWLLLCMCAGSRANYFLRAVRPDLAQEFAEQHDNDLWECLCELLQIRPAAVEPAARAAAQLPLSGGGLGLRSARRTGEAAFWASWADCLEMVQQRHPRLATDLLARLEAPSDAGTSSVAAAAAAAQRLAAAGMDVPSWQELAEGARPPPPPEGEEVEPGMSKNGWQFHAARTLDTAYRESELLPQLEPPERALLRSQGGPGAGDAFTALPTTPMMRIDSQPFRVLLLRRLRLPLPPVQRRCRCRLLLDPLGDHRAACPVAGVLSKRGFPLEAAAARICREAGGRVQANVFVRDLNVEGPPLEDGRRLEVVANNLPLFGGAQLAIDTTLVSPLRRDGTARPRADTCNGAALSAARRRKEKTYPELAGGGGRARLVVLAAEVGGRWSQESRHFLRQLARARARAEPQVLRVAAAAAWRRRWSCLLSVAAQRSFAESLLETAYPGGGGGADGETPSTDDVLAAARYEGLAP